MIRIKSIRRVWIRLYRAENCERSLKIHISNRWRNTTFLIPLYEWIIYWKKKYRYLKIVSVFSYHRSDFWPWKLAVTTFFGIFQKLLRHLSKTSSDVSLLFFLRWQYEGRRRKIECLDPVSWVWRILLSSKYFELHLWHRYVEWIFLVKKSCKGTNRKMKNFLKKIVNK